MGLNGSEADFDSRLQDVFAGSAAENAVKGLLDGSNSNNITFKQKYLPSVPITVVTP